MGRPSSQPQTWTDAQLTDAVKVSGSWRGVMRELGLNEMSAGPVRTVRRHAVQLGLDTSHFRGKRRWSDAQLRRVVSEAHSWGEVLAGLGLSTNSGNAQPHIKGHAIRLGLDISHLRPVRPVPSEAPPTMSSLKPHLKYLRVAGPTMAATWFALRGCAVSFPAEPTTYDLLVDASDGIRRVQVKTSTSFTKDGWMVGVGRRPNDGGKQARLVAYDPESIDLFFIIDGDFAMYLIPSRVLAGRVRVLLRTYKMYIVGNAIGLFGEAVGSGAGTMKVAARASA